jgi:hypothetical protein
MVVVVIVAVRVGSYVGDGAVTDNWWADVVYSTCGKTSRIGSIRRLSTGQTYWVAG